MNAIPTGENDSMAVDGYYACMILYLKASCASCGGGDDEHL